MNFDFYRLSQVLRFYNGDLKKMRYSRLYAKIGIWVDFEFEKYPQILNLELRER